jgi:hypothetical protein
VNRAERGNADKQKRRLLFVVNSIGNLAGKNFLLYRRGLYGFFAPGNNGKNKQKTQL